MANNLIIPGADFASVRLDKVDILGDAILVNVLSQKGCNATVTGTGIYKTGDIVTISAIGHTGYIFSAWSDGNTNATRQITVGKTNETYVAYFDAYPVFYCPLITDGVEQINNISPRLQVNVSYSEDGAYFTGNRETNGGIIYDLNVDYYIHTFYAEFKGTENNETYQSYIFDYVIKGSDTYHFLSIGVIASSSSLQLVVQGDSVVDGTINVPYTKNTWHKIAIKRGDENTLGSKVAVFLDGVKVYEMAIGRFRFNRPNVISIGNSWKVQETGNNIYRTFNGYIKNVKGYIQNMTDSDLNILTTL